MKEVNINQILSDQEVVTCSNCGNFYRIELLKEGEDWNDFGYRHCPFCGLITDEYANIS